MKTPKKVINDKVFTGFQDEEGVDVEWLHVIRVADSHYGVYDAVVEYAESLGSFMINNWDVKQVKNPPDWEEGIKKHENFEGKVWDATSTRGFIIYSERLMADLIRPAGVSFKVIGKIAKVYQDEETVGGKDWKVVYEVNGSQFHPKVGFDYDRGAMLFGFQKVHEKYREK